MRMTDTIPNFEEVLSGITNPDINKRQQAEQAIQQYKEENFYLFMISLIKIVNSKNPLKPLAGAILMNTMKAKDITVLAQISMRWQALSKEQSDFIKLQMINLLNTEETHFRTIISNVISGIIIAEDRAMNHSFLNTIIGEFNKSEKLNDGIYKILTVLVDLSGLSILRSNIDLFSIYSIMLNTLSSSPSSQLICFQRCVPLINRDYEKFFRFLLQAIDSETKIVIECLTEFIKEFHNQITFCDDILISVTNFLMSPFDLEVIEFWNSICDIVIKEKKNQKDSQLEVIIINRVPHVLSAFLVKLKTEDDEGWNAQRASSCLLQKIAEIYPEDILKNEIVQNFTAESLKEESGVVAFSSLICGATEEEKFLNYVINSVVVNLSNILKAENLLKAPENIESQNLPENLVKIVKEYKTEELNSLKEKNLWALSQICKYSFQNVKPQILSDLITLSKDLFTVSINACMLVKNIFNSIESTNNAQAMSSFYSNLLNTMIDSIEKIPLTQFELRNALFSCIGSGISACPPSFLRYLDDFLTYIIQKMEGFINELMEPKKQNTQNAFFIEDLLISYIQLTQSIIDKKTESLVPLRLKAKLKEIFLRILKFETKSLASTEVYITISFLCTDLSYFLANIEGFMRCAYFDLQNGICSCVSTEKCKYCQGFGTDQTTYKATLKFVGNIANLMDRGFIKYLEIVPLIIKGFESQVLPLDMKPLIISILADVCVSVGSSFSDYMEITMEMISEIYKIDRSTNISYVDNLRSNACLLVSSLLLTAPNSQIMISNEETLLKMLWFTFREDSYDISLFNLIKCIQDFIRKRNRTDSWIGELIEKGKMKGEKNEKLAGATVELKELFEEMSVYQKS